MRIVHQVATVSYSLFPLNRPLLPAPSIAGLLPAQAESQRQNAPPDTPSFTFSDPRLARLSDGQRQKLFDTATVLMEVATRFEVGELNDNALRAAASLFARKLTGSPATRYHGPDHFRAENDADLLAWLLGVEKRERERAARDQSERLIAERSAALSDRREVYRD